MNDIATSFTRITIVVREWLAAHTCQPEETTEARKEETDIDIDTILRVESRIRMDQDINAIEAAGNGILVILDDGAELSINAVTGHINRH